VSLFHPITVKCPFCDELVTVNAVGSVNADRRPDYRDAILEDRFQDTTCGSCEKSFRLQPEFNYLDAARRQWISALPAADMPNYLALEDEMTELFATSYGSKAPVAAQDVGKTLDVRVTFGWPAIREKLFARANNIDDVSLEIMKLDVLRQLPSAPLGPGIELRLVDMLGDDMIFAWLRTQAEEALEQFKVPAAWFHGIADNPDPWTAIRIKLTNGPFVDMQKLYMGEGRSAAE